MVQEHSLMWLFPDCGHAPVLSGQPQSSQWVECCFKPFCSLAFCLWICRVLAFNFWDSIQITHFFPRIVEGNEVVRWPAFLLQ